MKSPIRLLTVVLLVANMSLGACATAVGKVDPLKNGNISFERMTAKIPVAFVLQYEKVGSYETQSGGGIVDVDQGLERALTALLDAHFTSGSARKITIKAWPELNDAKPPGTFHWQVELNLELGFYDADGRLLTRLASTQRKDGDETGSVFGQSLLVGTLVGAPLGLQMEADWLADLYAEAVRQALVDLNQQLNEDQVLAALRP